MNRVWKIRLMVAISLLAGGWLWWSYETPNHRRIVFYGVVVDQHGQPVPRAEVYITLFYNSIFGAGQKRFTIQTKADGTFEVSGYKGRTLDIGLGKDGYDYAGDTGPFHYTMLVGKEAQFQPDEKNPVRFVMWKRKGAEPTVTYRKIEFWMNYDNAPHRIDLLKGREVKEGGDIIVRLSASKVSIEETRQKGEWDWDLVLEAVEGGFIPSRKKLMSEAPESGYAPSINLGRKMGDKHWDGQATGDYFVFTQGKLHTRMSLYFTGNPALGRRASLMLTWLTNPNGSRNLEYDPAKDVTEQYREKKRE
jgi:hypothetical protein